MNLLNLALSLFKLSNWMLVKHADRMNTKAIILEKMIARASEDRDRADESRNRAVRVSVKLSALME